MDCIETEKPETITPVAVSSANNSTENIAECSTSKQEITEKTGEAVDIKVIYNKTKYDVSTTLCTTVVELKRELQGLVGVPEKNQKLMFKGLLRDEQTLGSVGVTKGAKLMLVGSKPTDIMAVTSVTKQDVQESEKATVSKEPLSKQKIHRKVLDKGVPEDAMPGIKGNKEALPPFPLSGMLNKHGGKLRLTFKLEQDQLWLGTKERTEKLAMSSIKSIVSEPIEGHEQYHMMPSTMELALAALARCEQGFRVHASVARSCVKAFLATPRPYFTDNPGITFEETKNMSKFGIQLGPTEASRYWVYWVPAQYIDAIKDAILGKWQYF